MNGGMVIHLTVGMIYTMILPSYLKKYICQKTSGNRKTNAVCSVFCLDVVL